MARGLAEVVAEHNLSELIIDTKEVKLTVRRGFAPGAAPVVQAAQAAAPIYAAAPAAAPAAPAAAAAPPAVEDKAHVVTSPFVGTFYRKPNPDSPSYVSLNERVEKGAVLCIVEAMKLMNEIEADVSGTVVGILVEDGASVEYAQPLFRILP
ncbi:MAG: acetyl-CoA carboxylase biotin carboxyl carrier protein [Kofleriaceae bacterium]